MLLFPHYPCLKGGVYSEIEYNAESSKYKSLLLHLNAVKVVKSNTKETAMTTRMKPRMPSASNANLSHDSIRKVKHFYQLAKVYSVTAHKQVMGVEDSKEAPTTITWLTPEPHDSSKDQLFIDQHPIARQYCSVKGK
jgi:hypothetical protein